MKSLLVDLASEGAFKPGLEEDINGNDSHLLSIIDNMDISLDCILLHVPQVTIPH